MNVTLKTEEMAAKNSALPGINYILKYINMENGYFAFTVIFTVFLIK